MQPYNRPLSYPAVQSIFQRIPYEKRLQLSIRFKSLRGVHTRTPLSLECVKFLQPTDLCPGQCWEDGPEYSAILMVDGVMYLFNDDEVTEKVTISCSVVQGKKWETSERTVARRYFHHFLQFPIGVLCLQNCGRIFDDGQMLQCGLIRWYFGNYYCPLMLNYKVPANQRHRLEIHISRTTWIQLPSSLMRTVDEMEVFVSEHMFPELEHYEVRHFYSWATESGCDLPTPPTYLRATHRFKNPEAFVEACRVISNGNLRHDSVIQGVFEHAPNQRQTMWRLLLRRFKWSVCAEVNGINCLIMRDEDGQLTGVVHQTLPRGDVFEVSKHKTSPGDVVRRCTVIISNLVVPTDNSLYNEMAVRICDECGSRSAVQLEYPFPPSPGAPIIFILRFTAIEDVEKVVCEFRKVRFKINGCSRASARCVDGSRDRGEQNRLPGWTAATPMESPEEEEGVRLNLLGSSEIAVLAFSKPLNGIVVLCWYQIRIRV